MKKKKWKKLGFQPHLPHEVRTAGATSLGKTCSHACPSSAMFAETKSDTSKNSHTVYTTTKSNTGRNHKKQRPGTPSCALNGAGPQAEDTELHKKQNSPKDYTTPGGIKFIPISVRYCRTPLQGK